MLQMTTNAEIQWAKKRKITYISIMGISVLV